MKKYKTQVTRHLTFLTAIGGIILLSGLLMAVFGGDDKLSLGIVACAFGGTMCLICTVCLFAENWRTLVMHEDKMTVPVGGKKITVRFADIRSIESKSYKGIKLISGSCFFHTLKLKDGTRLALTLYAYGSKAEREIIETIKQSIK